MIKYSDKNATYYILFICLLMLFMLGLLAKGVNADVDSFALTYPMDNYPSSIQITFANGGSAQVTHGMIGGCEMWYVDEVVDVPDGDLTWSYEIADMIVSSLNLPDLTGWGDTLARALNDWGSVSCQVYVPVVQGG